MQNWETSEVTRKSVRHFVLMSCAWVFTICNSLVMIAIRDSPLVLQSGTSNIQTDLEFDRGSFCNIWPECFRIGSSILGKLNVLLAQWLSHSYLITHVVYGRNPNEYDGFLSLSISMIYRFASLGIVVFVIFAIFGSVGKALLLLNLIVFQLSGVVNIIFFELIRPLLASRLTEQRLGAIFQTVKVHSRMYVIYWDWMALAAVFLILYILISGKLIFAPKLALIVVGVGITSLFEHLGVVMAIAFLVMFIRNRVRKFAEISIFIVVGVFIYVSLLRLLARIFAERQTVSLSDTYRGYGMGNFKHIDRVLIGLFLVFIPILSLGCVFLIFSRYVHRFFGLIDVKVIRSTECLMVGLIFTYLVGFFTSGLSSELGRQTIGLQAISIVYIPMRVVEWRANRLSNPAIRSS